MRDLEREFLELKYTGDNPRVKYTFLDYTLKHVDLHIRASNLEKHGFHVMSQNEKVEKLLNGVAVSDFDSAIMDVRHRTDYANDFYAAKDYLANWYRLRKKSLKTSTRGSNVSSIHTAPAPNAKKRARNRKRMSDPDSKPPAKDLVKIAETATKLCEATPARYGFDPVEIAKLIRSRSIKYTVYSSEKYAS